MNTKIVENAAALTSRFQAYVSQADLDRHYQAVLKAKSQRTRLFGFRNSRAPIELIEGTHRSKLIEEAWRSALQESLYCAVKSLDKMPFCAPSMTSKVEKAPQSHGYQFSAQVEAFPEIKLKRIRECAFRLPKAELRESDIEEAIFQLKLQHASYKHAPRKLAEIHDRLVVNYQLLGPEGEVAREGKSWLKLDAKQRWAPPSSRDAKPEEPLKELSPEIFLGHQEGDQLTVELRPYPEAPMTPCRLTLTQILSPKYPEISRHWLKSLGIRPHTLAQLKQTLREQLSSQIELFRNNQLKFVILKLLDATHPELPVPTSLLLSSLKELGAQPAEGREPHDLTAYDPEMLERAARLSRPHLFLSYLIAHYSIQTSPEEVMSFGRKISHAGIEGLPKEQAAFDLKIREYLLEKKAIDIVKEGLIIDEPKLSFEEFFAYTQSQGREGPEAFEHWVTFNAAPEPAELASLTPESANASGEVASEPSTESPVSKGKSSRASTPRTRKPKAQSLADLTEPMPAKTPTSEAQEPIKKPKPVTTRSKAGQPKRKLKSETLQTALST